MKIINSITSVRFLVVLASLIPAILVASEGFAMSSTASHPEQDINSESAVHFSDNTAAKLKFFDAEAQQQARVFVQENGPTFVRKIKPFVQENGPTFVRRAQADGPNVPYAASPLSAVEVFAALQGQIDG